ncbi:MAG: hypothetical protein JW993_03020 [Sedimentisphaerales bacterium]|nr:hypothetical protein [Sedimentisphaerales bacterium]
MAAKGQRTSGSSTALALVCLLAMGNVAHGMVICVGAHGHLAIEPAGHDHCADDHVRSNAGRGDPLWLPRAGTGTRPYLCSYEHATRCEPCVDIPLLVGAFDGKTVPDASKAGAGLVPCVEHYPSPPGQALALRTLARFALPTSHLALSSVVLQV